MRTLFSCLLLASVASAGVEIRDLELCDGMLGPARTFIAFQPGEEVVARCQVVGLTGDDRSHARVSFAEGFYAADGTGYEEQFGLFDFGFPCGPEQIVSTSNWQTPVGQAAGTYTYRIKVTDLATGEEASAELEFEIATPAFVIGQVRFFVDRERTLDAPPGGVAGSPLFLSFKVFGVRGTPNLQVTYEILDAFREPTLAVPLTRSYGASEHGDAGSPSGAAAPTLELGLNRAGTFLLRILVTEPSSGREVTHKLRLRIEEEGG